MSTTETHDKCPDYAGQWFHRSTGACSCGATHSLADRKRATFARTSDAVLWQTLNILTNKASRSTEERMALAWVSDEITLRFDLETELDDIFSDENYAGTYEDALRSAYAKRQSA